MALLKDILYRVSIISTSGDMDTVVKGVAFDSRKVKKGDVFIAVKGSHHDGHVFVEKAIKKGAVAVVMESVPMSFIPKIAYAIAKDSAKALGMIVANFYGNPSDKLKLIGVTGTNGKTTVTTLLYRLYAAMGYKVGLLSTIENRVNEEVIPATHTTPDTIQIHELLVKMVKVKCSHCFMEVSSHAADQGRISGLNFDGGVFTNISHDHLNYHKTFACYINAKKKFFDDLPYRSFALVNADDKRENIMVQNTRGIKKTFSLKRMADFKAKLITSTIDGIEMEIDGRNVWFKLIGDFNAYNILAVYAVAQLLGQDREKVLTLLSAFTGVNGRIEPLTSSSQFTAIVDYSHTPDALKNVLKAVCKFKREAGKIILVVGCGGDRDVMKRPLMAAIACKYGDKVIFTSDNPRSEDPLKIIYDMRQGISGKDKKSTLVIPDREEAIKTACMMANKQDIVLVTGRGHEVYQEIKGKEYPFSDKEVLERMMKLFN